MMSRALLAGLAGFTLLAAYEPTTSGPFAERPQAQEMLEKLYDLSFAITSADTLGSGCNTAFNLRLAAGRAIGVLSDDLQNPEYIASDGRQWERNLPRARIQVDLIDYVEQNNVVIGDRASTCAAARKEIAANSDIGRFLRVL